MRLPKPRALRRDRRGVASTVGTIMALLVILTFFTLFINQYVPAWSKEAEAAHMNTALGGFGSLKGAVDTQILSAQAAVNSGSTYIPTETFTPIQLGTETIPVFSNPSVGRIDGNSDHAPWSVQFTYGIGATDYVVNETSSGNIVLDVENRYHVPFTLAYEGGGILMSQSAGQAVRVDPQFTVVNATSGVEVGLVLIQFIGSGNVAGTGTEGVRTKLLAVDMQEYTGLESPLWINHTTAFGPAWYLHLNETLALAFGVLDADFESPGYNYTEVPDGTGQQVTTPFYTLSRAQDNLTHILSLEIANGGAGASLAKLTLHHAFVSIAVGRSSSTLEV